MKQEVFTIKLLAPKNHLHNSKTQKNLYKCLRGHTYTQCMCTINTWNTIKLFNIF